MNNSKSSNILLKCPKCTFSTTTSDPAGRIFFGSIQVGLLKHFKQEHGTNLKQQHKCDFCGKSFPQARKLNKHIRKIHTVYIDECGKIIANPKKKLPQQQVHVVHKKFKCVSCGESYSKLRKLNKHIREIHKVYVNLSSYVEPMHVFGSRNIDNTIPKEKLPSEELEFSTTDPIEKIPSKFRVIDNHSILHFHQ